MCGSKILIIDDDADDVAILAEAFTHSGVESVHSVRAAKEAFTYLETIKNTNELPRLIVTDYFLLGTTGSEFLKEIKGMARYKHISVIILSTIKLNEEIEKYKLLGADDYLEKPNSYIEYLKVASDITERLTKGEL